jgi:ABC-type phosphate transport system permease subunit
VNAGVIWLEMENAMRQSNAIANVLFVFGPFVLMAFMVVATIPMFAIVAVGILYLIGISLLVVSKRSLFRDGVWFSFGPSQMNAKNRRRYFSAYGIIAVGMLINITSLLIHN